MAERRIKTVVVDDSTAVRSMVAGWVREAPGLDLVGAAADGESGIRLCRIYDPDVVVLDVEMPGMSGLEALRHLMKSDPTRVVIMFSALTREGATATIDALAAGAADCIAKPSSMGGGRAGLDDTRRQLVEMATVLGERRHRTRPQNRFAAPPRVVPQREASGVPSSVVAPLRAKDASASTIPSRSAANPIAPTPRPRRTSKIEAVVIGSSTGGPAALTEVIPKLPKSVPVPMLLVQHMPALFTEMLAERLNAKSEIRVKIAEDGEALEASTLYVAPGGIHFEVKYDQGRILRCVLIDGVPELSCKPSANVLFRSAAKVWGSNLLGVVLTGMGQDGCDGASEISKAGGSIIIQDEPSSVVWGMPGAIAHQGFQDGMFPLSEIAGEITKRVSPSLARRDASTHMDQPLPARLGS